MGNAFPDLELYFELNNRVGNASLRFHPIRKIVYPLIFGPVEQRNPT